MTKFDIVTTSQHKFRWVLRFVTRFTPVILYGEEYDSKEACVTGLEEMRNQIGDAQQLQFSTTQKGYSFNILSRQQHIIAFSRLFATRKLMKRVLEILKHHIAATTVNKERKPVDLEMAA